MNYLLAKQQSWRMLMRVEDLDSPRVRAESASQMLAELRWLGLDWQEPVVYQSHRGAIYQAALDHLASIKAAYPCVCSRRDIEHAASAPHGHEGEVAYPGTCSNRYATAQEATQATGRPAAWRMRVDDEPIIVHDQFAGERTYNLARSSGDFVIFKNDHTAAYQLAVVVDDAAAGVDAIVRGDDLLDSTPRQIHLRRLLGLGQNVLYWHLPLVVGPDGRRLAKRHGDTRLSHYVQLGATPQRILGMLGHWCGLLESRRETDMNELLTRFDLSRMPREQIVFTAQDDAFLRGI